MKKIIKMIVVVLMLISTKTQAQTLVQGAFIAKTGSAVFDSLELKVVQTTSYSTATQYTVYNGNTVYAPGYVIVVGANSLTASKNIAVQPGQSYSFKVKSSRTGCFSNTVCYTLSTLAIKNLTLFDVSASDKGVSVLWNMLKDDDVNNYVIERSLDGREFKEIGYLLHEPSLTPTHYSYVDKTISIGNVYYYRLKMVNNNGKIEYSNIVPVNLKVQTKKTLQVTAYPNPVINSLTVLLDGKQLTGDYKIQVLDMFGHVVLEKIPSGSTVNVSTLPNGEYVFKVIVPLTKQAHTTTIIKH